MEPILRDSPNLYEYWMLAVFALIFVILAYMRVAYSRRLDRLFNSLARLQILRQVMREELVFSHRASVLLFLNFVLVSSLLIYGAQEYYGLSGTNYIGWHRFVLLVLLILILYLGKLITGNLLRRLFADPGIIREYLFEVFLINKASGVILLPLAVGMAFINVSGLSVLFSLVAIVVSLILLFRLVQGLRISFNYPVSRVYIILYLCTLEILPFLLLFAVLGRI